MGDSWPHLFRSPCIFMFWLTKWPYCYMAQLLVYVDFLAKAPEFQDNWQGYQRSTASSGRPCTQFCLLTHVVEVPQFCSTLDP